MNAEKFKHCQEAGNIEQSVNWPDIMAALERLAEDGNTSRVVRRLLLVVDPDVIGNFIMNTIGFSMESKKDMKREPLGDSAGAYIITFVRNSPYSGSTPSVTLSRDYHSTLRRRGNFEQENSSHRDSGLRGRAANQRLSLRSSGLARQGRGGRLNAVQENNVWQPDSSDPCCQCGSHVHQLKHHPNPNTPQEYLRGCLHCNKLSHPFSKCPHRQDSKRLKWYYLRTCRTGLCPAEDFRDFREISKLDNDEKAQYCVETNLPLTPQFALKHIYPDEKNFQHPLEGGDYVLFEDPFWESGDPLADLGCFGIEDAPADNREQERWIQYTGLRRYDLWKQVEERRKACLLDSIPTQVRHNLRGTKREKSSTPSSDHVLSSQAGSQTFAHNKLPIGTRPRNHFKSPEFSTTHRLDSSQREPAPAPHRQQTHVISKISTRSVLVNALLAHAPLNQPLGISRPQLPTAQ
ncbi:hypothetical protein BKA64DRAFT_761404 [Cadophora sp. MPI-SDFR-AT-0126]|nr:hypothetical protein BKA64DRAFT_761404 [Leotiomycetes sp. MPI-SDFR-AT-0126]